MEEFDYWKWIRNKRMVESSLWHKQIIMAPFFPEWILLVVARALILFFDNFVTSTTDLRVCCQIRGCVEEDREKERVMRILSMSISKYQIVNDGEFLLKHVAQLYTRKVSTSLKMSGVKLTDIKLRKKDVIMMA